MTDRTTEGQPVASPIWKRDFPYEAAAEEEVTRREFARYLVAGCRRARASATSASPAWTQLRTINEGEPRAVVGTDTASRSAAPTCSGTRPTQTPPSCCASATPTWSAFSQKCTHLGCVVYYEADEHRWHCPCHEGNFDARDRRRHLRSPAPASGTHRCRDP
jgi:hypothetical protein